MSNRIILKQNTQGQGPSAIILNGNKGDCGMFKNSGIPFILSDPKNQEGREIGILSSA